MFEFADKKSSCMYEGGYRIIVYYAREFIVVCAKFVFGNLMLRLLFLLKWYLQ